MSAGDLKKEIIRELNQKYGKSLAEITKCNELYETIQQQKIKIAAELDLTGKENLGTFLSDTENAFLRCDKAVEQSKQCVQEIEKSLDSVDTVRKELKEHFEELNSLQCALQYIKVIQRIEFLNIELQRGCGKKDDEECVTAFANLCEISRNLVDFPGEHLITHLKGTIHHWHKILKDKLTNDFEGTLKAIKWPFINANFSMVIPSQANIQKLQLVAEYLLQIELPSETSTPNTSPSGVLSDFTPTCLPIHELILPLRKRFLYHFYGSRQTNRPDKPEWYLTQILTWIRDHRDFAGKYFQPVIDKLGLHHVDAKLELTRGLVQLAVEKLYSDLPSIQYDDFTFSHTVDEALGFDKELRETYNYPPNQPSVLLVLTQAQIFLKWLTMEKKYAIEKMDAILSFTASPFEPLASDIEDLKITVCADAFITLLQTITDRYESLPQPGHRLQFLELQLQLLDDFRVRLLQLVHAEHGDIVESNIPMIANTVCYIESVLVDWGTMLHFLNLYYYKSQFERLEPVDSIIGRETEDLVVHDVETESVFGETLLLYSHLRKDLVYMLSESVVMEVRARGKPYRRERWSAVPPQKDFKALSLTPTACPMFEVLARRLHQLQKGLTGKLFGCVWRTVARQVDEFLFEDLVLDSRFSEGGALQLKFDVHRNLLPLFSQYTEKPAYYFTQLVESCNLLNISKGSALLLRETLLALEGATGIEDQRGRALQDVGVTSLTPKMAVTVLNQRTDITVNRMAID